jgi:hypothetical protein
VLDLRFGEHGVPSVLLRRSVLTAVEFDNRAQLDAAEIGETMTNPVVAAKFESLEAFGSEMSPQL